MKAFRWAILSVCVAATAAWLGGCGNGLDDGSEPSGSIIRVVSVSPTTLTPSCSSNSSTTVEMLNDSRPNQPSTNSFVVMSTYRVDFTGLTMTVDIPSLDGAGGTVGISPDSTASMDVVVIDAATLNYIQSYYPSVGVSQPLTLQATITIWGKDAFQADVSTTAKVTIVIGSLDCSSSSSSSSSTL